MDISAALFAAMLLAAKLCLPILGASLVAGVAIAVFQAITQISDSVLSFLPKLIATCVAAWVTGPFMAIALRDFMAQMIDALIAAGGH